MKTGMSKILVVGNLTLDIVHSVAGYPAEDTEIRATAQRFQRGGNGATTALVLAQHGHRVSFAGTLGDDHYSQQLAGELTDAGIDMQYCHIIADGACPLSCITHNQQSGSRTIVHYRELAEYPAAAFTHIALTEYDWFHFEGRNLEQLAQMLTQLQQVRRDQAVSLEIEKARPGIEQLFSQADILLFSRAYAAAKQIDTPAGLFEQTRREHGEAILVCAWGEQGAYAQTRTGEMLHAPAHAVAHICDSIGAGDTFNAGMIHGLLSGQTLSAALDYANALAARKLQQVGFEKLVN